jgi:hypothetical protein
MYPSRDGEYPIAGFCIYGLRLGEVKELQLFRGDKGTVTIVNENDPVALLQIGNDEEFGGDIFYLGIQASLMKAKPSKYPEELPESKWVEESSGSICRSKNQLLGRNSSNPSVRNTELAGKTPNSTYLS